MFVAPILVMKFDNMLLGSYVCTKYFKTTVDDHDIFNAIQLSETRELTMLDDDDASTGGNPALSFEYRSQMCLYGVVLVSFFAFLIYQTIFGFHCYISQVFLDEKIEQQRIIADEKVKLANSKKMLER